MLMIDVIEQDDRITVRETDGFIHIDQGIHSWCFSKTRDLDYGERRLLDQLMKLYERQLRSR